MTQVHSREDALIPTEKTEKPVLVHRPGPIWECKIGIRGDRSFPMGADAPMRRAIKAAFREVVGEDAEFTFSGWSATLTENEMAVVENRAPHPAAYANARLIAAAPDLLAFAVALDTDWTAEFPDGPDTDFSDRTIRLADDSVALWRQCRAAIARATGDA